MVETGSVIGSVKADTQLCEDMDNMIRSHVPKWQVIAKAASCLHMVIGFLLSPFMDYMGSFWTTIGYTSAYPDGSREDWESRAHEGRHACQAQKVSRLAFYALYLFPQCLVPVFILLGFLSPWLWLGAFICALPLPAPWRAYWELDAYKITIFTMALQKRQDVDRVIDAVVSQHFAGPTYYYMFPFRSYVRKKLNQAKLAGMYWQADPFYSEKFKSDKYVMDVYNVMLTAGKVRI